MLYTLSAEQLNILITQKTVMKQVCPRHLVATLNCLTERSFFLFPRLWHKCILLLTCGRLRNDKVSISSILDWNLGIDSSFWYLGNDFGYLVKMKQLFQHMSSQDFRGIVPTICVQSAGEIIKHFCLLMLNKGTHINQDITVGLSKS